MALILGVAIICVAVYLLVKQYESRLVLFCAGLGMAVVALDPMAAFKAYSGAMHEQRLFEPITAVMGFSFVMRATECDKHLIMALAKVVRRTGPLLIPAATLITLVVNTSIASSAGSAAACGAILIPLVMSAGVHPAIAASAVWAGTFGNMLNPGFAQVLVVSDVAKATPFAVVSNHAPIVIACGVIGALSLGVVAHLRKEHRGHCVETLVGAAAAFKVSPAKALVPVIPLALLLLGSTGAIPVLKQVGISHAMIIGVFVAFAVTRVNPETLSKEFWRGIGEAFALVFGIIICALVFVGGMQALGLVKALVGAMATRPDIAKIGSSMGPFVLGFISGSGDAAAVAFNKAITVDAARFGLHPMNMGSMAALAGALGRSMSPIAGGAIICAGLAGVNPLEITKRNWPGMILATSVATITLLYVR